MTVTLKKVPRSPDVEYTAEQRKAIDARLEEAESGPQHGPFHTADEAIDFLTKEISKRKAKRKAS